MRLPLIYKNIEQILTNMLYKSKKIKGKLCSQYYHSPPPNSKNKRKLHNNHKQVVRGKKEKTTANIEGKGDAKRSIYHTKIKKLQNPKNRIEEIYMHQTSKKLKQKYHR